MSDAKNGTATLRDIMAVKDWATGELGKMWTELNKYTRRLTKIEIRLAVISAVAAITVNIITLIITHFFL